MTQSPGLSERSGAAQRFVQIGPTATLKKVFASKMLSPPSLTALCCPRWPPDISVCLPVCLGGGRGGEGALAKVNVT